MPIIINPEAEARYRAQRRNSTIASLLIGILVLLLIGAIFFKIAVYINNHKTEPIVTFSAPAEPQSELKKPKVTTQVTKKPSPSSSSSASQVLAAVNTTSSFSVPVPDNITESLSLNFGAQEGFGSGWGDTGSGFGQSGGGALTLFGRTDGSGLVGNFYDQKIDRKKKITALGKVYKSGDRTTAHANLIRDLFKDDFSESRMEEFYVADTKLSFTQLVMENEDAQIAPEAFNVQDEVTPSGWIVIYEGSMAAPKTDYYKFVGRFDDLLLVFIDDKLVFDGSWRNNRYTDFQSSQKIFGRKSLIPQAFLESDYIKLDSNNKIKIIVGETPGGFVGGGLFIKEKGKKYKVANGQEILPPFSTEPLSKETKERLLAMPIPIEVDDVPVFGVL